MVELMRTTDLVHLSWAQAMLEAEGIPFLLVDLHTSSVEGRDRRLPAPAARAAGADHARAPGAGRGRARDRGRRRRLSDLTEGTLLGGRVRLLQPRQGYRVAIDPVLLAAAVPARTGESVLDAGLGSGAASLCLLARVPGCAACGIELQPALAELARRNALLNGMAVEVVEGDLLEPPAALRGRQFAHVITNPPYAEAGGGPVSPDPQRGRAHAGADIAAWIDACLKRLEPRWLPDHHPPC